MASNVCYAVKKGKITGVFDNWEACRASVDGFSGAEYKKFSSRAAAEAYLGIEEETGDTSGQSYGAEMTEKDVCVQEALAPEDIPPEGRLLAYVDGSYEDSLKRYGFGCVFILPDERIYTEYGSGDNPQSLRHRNVTGEMLGAMYAVRVAMKNGFAEVEIRYDYEGIEKWVTGEWKSQKELTRKYADSMRMWGQTIRMIFVKVPAHSRVRFNELADRLAREGLERGNGVPEIKLLKEMKSYGRTDEIE